MMGLPRAIAHVFGSSVLLVAVLASGCGTSTSPIDISAGEMLLYVSNQSFEDSPVDIRVTIDGAVVVDDRFSVGNQHDWVRHQLSLAPGEHRLRAESGMGVLFETTFTTPADEALWAVLEYWWYPEEEARYFTFSTHDEPVEFY
ncbi:MAG: hypothetical protein JJE47_12270 [Acidimicrobiia bacterium]|nr:hypothetical protein [Acidimicrobiia bacterium]